MKLYLHLEQKEFTVSQQLAPEVTVKQLKEAFVAEYNEKQTAKWQKLNPKYLTAKSEDQVVLKDEIELSTKLADKSDVFFVLQTTGLSCTNNGCNETFDQANNTSTACQYHPGVPIFHEGLKGWTCCKKRTTDFSEFLDMPGCTRGYHTVVEPPKPVKEKPKPLAEGEVIEVSAPPAAVKKRTVCSDPFEPIKTLVSPSVEATIDRLLKKLSDSTDSEISSSVCSGTPCSNATCDARYVDDSSYNEECVYHPGNPVFHEGYKYWSCCKKRTCDFNEFLSQPGCSKGKHLWKIKKEAVSTNIRFDWYQNATTVILTFYAKNVIPGKSSFEANRTSLKYNVTVITPEGQVSTNSRLDLGGDINVKESRAEIMSTKVEVKLRKLDNSQWKTLEMGA